MPPVSHWLELVKALLWWYASHQRRLIDGQLDAQRITLLTQRGFFAPAIFLLSIIVAMFNPMLAMWSWGLVGLILALR